MFCASHPPTSNTSRGCPRATISCLAVCHLPSLAVPFDSSSHERLLGLFRLTHAYHHVYAPSTPQRLCPDVRLFGVHGRRAVQRAKSQTCLLTDVQVVIRRTCAQAGSRSSQRLSHTTSCHRRLSLARWSCWAWRNFLVGQRRKRYFVAFGVWPSSGSAVLKNMERCA